jgi:hypothetical protein
MPKDQRKGKPDSQAERLRAILCGTGDRLPRVGLETLRRFHGYLADHPAFPFAGRLGDPIGPHRDTRSPLTVIRLMDPIREYAPEEMHGLICKAEQNGHRIELPWTASKWPRAALITNCWKTTATGCGPASSRIVSSVRACCSPGAVISAFAGGAGRNTEGEVRPPGVAIRLTSTRHGVGAKGDLDLGLIERLARERA